MLEDAETKEHVLQAYKTCFSTLMRKLDEYDVKLRAAAKESATCPAQANNRPGSGFEPRQSGVLKDECRKASRATLYV